jgi:short-chain fatty acids transporter
MVGRGASGSMRASSSGPAAHPLTKTIDTAKINVRTGSRTKLPLHAVIDGLFSRTLSKVGAFAHDLVRRLLPDPFVLVLLLTLVALALALFTMDAVPGNAGATLLGKSSALVKIWTEGFGNAEILKFAMQITLIVITGEAIAASPPAKKILARLVSIPKTATQALLIVTTYAVITGWIHWGFGLVSSALLAREVGRSLALRGVKIHYPLLGTGAYTSMLLWHAGLTASAPLLMNTEKNFVSDVLGIHGAAAKVPLTETIFAETNLIVCAVLVLVVPLLIAAMQPVDEQEIVLPDLATMPKISDDVPPSKSEHPTIAERLDAARALPLATGAVGFSFLFRYLREHGFDLNHNVVNCTFLMLGLMLHPSATSYARAIAQSVRGVSGILLQFPFYGGILAVLSQSGLSEKIAHAFVAMSSAHSLPFFTFVASIATKSFVPSGAGEWAVEGPVMLKAAQALGVPFGKVTMGVAYGNMLGNMIQPFWSLPLLGLMGLRARDIMGYGLVIFVVCFPILGAALLFW